jgi:hypothetical protein
MSTIRMRLAIALTVTVGAAACMDAGNPLDIVVSDGAGLPAPCALWSCDENYCGGPTSSPYHACCQATVYDAPYGSAAFPGTAATEPNCATQGGSGGTMAECAVADNYCFQDRFGCNHLALGSSCPGYCPSTSACAGDIDSSNCELDWTSQASCCQTNTCEYNDN